VLGSRESDRVNALQPATCRHRHTGLKNIEAQAADDFDAVAARLYRQVWGRALAALVRLLRDLDSAEDALQEGLAGRADTLACRRVPIRSHLVAHYDCTEQSH